MTSLFRYLCRAVIVSALPVVTFSVTLQVFALLLPNQGRLTPSVLWIFLAFALFQIILANNVRPISWFSRSSYGLSGAVAFKAHFRFAGMALLLALPTMGLFVWAIIAYLNSADVGKELTENRKFAIGVTLFLMVIWPTLLVLLTLFGTMFPAVAQGRPIRFGYALTASRKTWWKVFLQLLLLPVPLGLAMFLVSGAVLSLFPEFLFTGFWSLIPGVIVDVLNNQPAVVVIGILCRAYEQAYPAEPMTDDTLPSEPVRG